MPDLLKTRRDRSPACRLSNWGSGRQIGIAGALAAAIGSVLVLAACGGSSSSSASSASNAASVSAQHPVTLVVQDGDGGETGLLNAYAALNKQFEAMHPGVHIKFVVKSFQDLTTTLKLQLSGSSGVPDVTQDNEGYQSLGALVTDGLVQNLSGIAAKDDWSARQPASLLALDGAFSSDGKTMGSGSLWGISSTGTWVGLFENTAIAKKLGITTLPATLTQLEQDMAAAKAHGILPFQLGTNDQGVEAAWLMYELVMDYTTPQELSTITDGVSDTLPSAISTAAKTIQEWQNDGYFTSGSAAYTSTDVFNKFVTGQGLFVLSGSWAVPLPGTPATTAKYRLFPVPLARSGEIAAVASGDLPWSIPTHSPHPQLAAEYIDYITSPAANSVWINAGQVPASLSSNELQEATAAHLNASSYDAVADWVALLKKGYPEPYIDWSTPTFLTTIGQGLQSVIGGKMTATAFQASLQSDYGPYTKQRHG